MCVGGVEVEARASVLLRVFNFVTDLPAVGEQKSVEKTPKKERTRKKLYQNVSVDTKLSNLKFKGKGLFQD